MSYTYFAATLSALSFDGEPTMTETEFRDRCREYLSASDFRTLTALLDGGESSNTFVRKWRNSDTQLRNAVARMRAARIGDGADASKWLRNHTGFEVSTETAVAAAFQEPNPMRREMAIERIRWNLAGELAGFDAFSAETLFAYAIRLGILCRRAAADVDKGTERLRAMMKVKAESEA